MVSISLCMIVKNEEATLGRCLESVENIADEIIIVDTGSTDSTKKVALQHGAKIYDFEWIDDFSAARNFSFDKATKEYILWLDADDVLLADNRTKLLALKESLGKDVDAVSMLYDTEFDADGNVITSTRRTRIVRRSSHFRWIGIVHEDVVSDSASCVTLPTSIVITHKKPRSGPNSNGSDRNLRIYEKHLKAGHTMIPRDIFHYARELQMNKKFKKAIPYHLKFLHSKDVDKDLAVFTLHNLATCYYMVGNEEKEWECTLRSLEYDIPRPEFSCRFGERFLQKNEFEQAIFWYQLALNHENTSQKEGLVESHIYRTWLPHKQLAYCYYQLGDYAKSLVHNQEALKLLPNERDIKTNIATLTELLKSNS